MSQPFSRIRVIIETRPKHNHSVRQFHGDFVDIPPLMDAKQAAKFALQSALEKMPGGPEDENPYRE